MRPGTLGGAGGDSGVSGAASGGGGGAGGDSGVSGAASGGGGGAASAAEALGIWQPELPKYVNRGHDLLLSLIFHTTIIV